jgi:two-component system, response regulator YesN
MFKVLIIDDEKIIREGLRSAIDWEELDCKLVGEAEDGDQGVEMVRSLLPDIVFADIRMPGLNGLEMISKIKELKHECKIIILTGFREFEYAQQAVRLGAFRFLLKPTKKEELIIAVTDAIKEIKISRSEQKLFINLKKKVKEEYLTEEEANKGDELTEEQGKKSKYLINKALNYMKANYANNLNLNIVSKELYISTWYLSKLLKKETGSTFIDLLNEIRIEEAKKLLTNPKYKIYEVAEMIGFEDVPYFTKLFKRITGLKPTDYKNKLKQ